MPEPTKVLAFDIGIRNLAWCLLERQAAGRYVVHGWENYDLIAGSATQEAKTRATIVCAECALRAAYARATDGVGVCWKHCPAERPALRDLSGALVKTLPKLGVLRTWVQGLPKSASRAAILERLAAKASLPLEKPKATRAQTEDLSRMHDSIRTFVLARAALFGGADCILLENQPAFKNPTMKSVQMLLFATIRDVLFSVKGSCPTTGFVHAGKKVQGVTKGDAGYAARKRGSEERVQELFEKGSIVDGATWSTALASNQKRSDMCDAMCMCVDRL